MMQIQNDIQALNDKNKDQKAQVGQLFSQLKSINDQYRMITTNILLGNQGNLFEKKVSKNIHSIIVSFLSFRDIMRLKLVNQYNRDLILFQYPELIQRYQNKLSLLKEQQQTQVIDEQLVQQMRGYLGQLTKSQLTEFLSFKNPHKIVEDVQIALYQLLNNTIKADYNNLVKPYLKGNQNQILSQMLAIDKEQIKEQVLYQIKNILTPSNEAQMQSISMAANGVYRYLQGIHLYSELPQVKVIRDIKEVENILKVLLKVKE